MSRNDCKLMEGKFCTGKFEGNCELCIQTICEKHLYKISKLIQELMISNTILMQDLVKELHVSRDTSNKQVPFSSEQ